MLACKSLCITVVKTNNVIYQQNVIYYVKIFISMGGVLFAGWLFLLIIFIIIFQPKENDGFNSDVIQQRPPCNHYSHQQTDSCAVGPKVPKAVSEFLFVPTILRLHQN